MMKRKTKARSGLKDVWNAFMCEDAIYTNNDIPICPTTMTDIPDEMITWEEAKCLHKKLYRKDKDYHYNAFICFYIDDYKFDGARTSIWLYPLIAIRVLIHFKGIVTPDFSTYQDFPYPCKLWNTFRMRAFGYWAGKQGLEIINNVRWGTGETYHYCFDGIETGSVIAIGTVGGSPNRIIDRQRFEEGLKEMIIRLKPSCIIVYGSSNYPCFDMVREKGIKLVTFKSSTAAYYDRRNKDE